MKKRLRERERERECVCNEEINIFNSQLSFLFLFRIIKDIRLKIVLLFFCYFIKTIDI